MRLFLILLLALAPFTRAWTQRPVILVGLGDSMTRGEGASPGHSYFERLQATPSDESPAPTLTAVFPHLKAENLAVASTTSFDLERQLKRLSAVPKGTLGWVTITTGGNDLVHFYGMAPPRENAMYGATLAQAQPWIAGYQARLEKIVGELDQRFPAGCQIFIANIYDPTDGKGDIENAPDTPLPAWPDGLAILKGYDDAIARVAEKHPNVHVVDLHARFMGHGFHHGDNDYWFFDLEHPNNLGYRAVEQAFMDQMATAAANLR